MKNNSDKHIRLISWHPDRQGFTYTRYNSKGKHQEVVEFRFSYPVEEPIAYIGKTWLVK